MFTRTVVTALALASAASAQLKVISPGGPNLWWVANSQNTLVWNCKESQFQNFTVLIANSDPKILVAPQAIIAVQNNFDCSKSITTQQATLTPATGYTVQLANPINNTDVYATSDPFEVKAQGSAYPDPSATPTASGTGGASGSGSGTGTQTGGNAQNTNAAAMLSAGGTLVGVVGFMAGVAGLL